jgi:hypothetical protein
MASITFTKKEYKLLLELVCLGEYVKGEDNEDVELEKSLNSPLHLLTQRMYKEAVNFDCGSFVEEHASIKGLYLHKDSDELWDEYLSDF